MMRIAIDKEMVSNVLGSRLPIKNNPKHFYGYSRIIDSKEFSIYERAYKADKIVAAYGNVVVKQHGLKKLIYIPDARVSWINYHIRLNKIVFPNLYKKSVISQCLLIPYLRNIKKDTYVRDIRLCIITDKGQIYHNKPNRNIDNDGFSKRNDVIKFEESAIWDIPGRKHPTLNQNPLDYECYYPGLPLECYDYSPLPCDSPEFVDRYGNGGFKKYKEIVEHNDKKICSRYYRYATTSRTNPFFFIGTGNRNDKMCLIGTYRANVDCGSRICLFASSDGGREWFCKYEFSDIGEYSFQQGYTDKWGTNYGHKINININVDCLKLDLNVYKRNLVLPDSSDGKVQTEFNWEYKSKIKKIYSDGGTIIETCEKHGLITGNIIALKGNAILPKDIAWASNDLLSSDGHNNMIQFKIRKIDDYKVEIYELLSSLFPTLPCRHIHHINTLKDGWIVGTGEIYPNGWLLYFQQKKADTYSVLSAAEPFSISRLNTNETSVQRTMGLIVEDTFDSKIIFASDHDTLERNKMCFQPLNNVSRGSLGVFIGKLEDIDDRNKYECVYDATEPCYFFQQIQDMIVFAGQRGELAICVDDSLKKWSKIRLNRFIMHYMGFFNNYHFFNDYIIFRK